MLTKFQIGNPVELLDGVAFTLRPPIGKSVVCRVTREALTILNDGAEDDEPLVVFHRYWTVIELLAATQFAADIKKPLLTEADVGCRIRKRGLVCDSRKQ